MDVSITIALVAVGGWNLATWATYRIDKARARAARGDRRIPERVLLGMAAAGGSLGALLAVYAHRQRHKAKKLGFVAWLWTIVVAQVVVASVVAHALLN